WHADAQDYFPAYDDLFVRTGARFATRSLRHAAQSRRVIDAYRRGELLEVTNALVDRYGFSWVTEDVGLWPIAGPSGTLRPSAAEDRAVQKPSLNHESLMAAVRHARVVRAALEAPLLLDFPSFATLGAGIGAIHAFDFFRALADEADVAVSFDA